MVREIGRVLLFGGLILALIYQLAIVWSAFRHKWLHGLLCLVAPGYVLFFARRHETRQTKNLLGWGIGTAFVLIGAALATR